MENKFSLKNSRTIAPRRLQQISLVTLFMYMRYLQVEVAVY